MSQAIVPAAPTAVVNPPNPATGRGGRATHTRTRRPRGGNRLRGYPGRGHPRDRKQHASSFKGDTSDMNGHVFQCHSETSDPKQFSVTLEKLSHYVFKTFKYATDIGRIFDELKTPEITRPIKPTPPDSEDDVFEAAEYEMECAIFVEDVKEYVKRRNVLKENIQKLYSISWGQCSKAMRAKLGAIKGFKDVEDTKKTATLLREIKGVSYEYDGHRNPYLALDDAKTKFYSYLQKGESNTMHFNTFRALVEVVEHHGGNIANDEALINIEIDKLIPSISWSAAATGSSSSKGGEGFVCLGTIGISRSLKIPPMSVGFLKCLNT